VMWYAIGRGSMRPILARRANEIEQKGAASSELRPKQPFVAKRTEPGRAGPIGPKVRVPTEQGQVNPLGDNRYSRKGLSRTVSVRSDRRSES
jgi:hypothetical protein